MQHQYQILQHQSIVIHFLSTYILVYSIPQHNSVWIRQGGEITLNSSMFPDTDETFEALIKLIQVIQKDPAINKKVIKMLKLDPYQRRFVLNKWLEQLRVRHASQHLLSALPYLFDDKIAEEVLKLINDA
jgi:hypothetical protein